MFIMLLSGFESDCIDKHDKFHPDERIEQIVVQKRFLDIVIIL